MVGIVCVCLFYILSYSFSPCKTIDSGKSYRVRNKPLFCFQSMHLTEEPNK